MALSDDITKLLHKIASDDGFIDYQFESDAGSKHGDGFLGIMIAVKLIGTKKVNGELIRNVAQHLLCKLPPSNPVRRQLYQPILAFEHEVQLYAEVLPAFLRFQQERGLTSEESFVSYPNARVVLSDLESDNHILIMDDLRQQNFKMFPKERRTNIKHATLVLTEMAKFHAISFALKDQQPKQFKQLKRDDVYIEMIQRGKMNFIIEESLQRACQMVVNEKHKEVLVDLKENYLEIFEKYASESELGDSGVIAHGDCWNNNFLFKYDENEEYESPSAVMFVDWQLSRYASPVLDIFYFISTATDKTFRDAHYHDLIRSYHSSLSDSIRKLGSDPEKLYSFDRFQIDLKKYSRFAIYFGSFMTQFCIAEQKDIGDVDEYCRRIESGEKCNLLMNFDDNSVFRALVNDLIGDLFSYGYFD